MTAVVDGGLDHLTVLENSARESLFTHARTSNTFAPDPVSDETLQSIWDLTKWGPTAANTQPLRVLYVRTDAGKDRLLAHIFEGNKAKTASAPVVAVLAADTDFHEFVPQTFPMRPEMKDYWAADEAMRIEQAKFNATLQAGYFTLAIRAAGLAAGPMAGFDNAGVDAEFFPGGRLRSILVVNIGHPGDNPWFDRLPRLDHEDALSWA